MQPPLFGFKLIQAEVARLRGEFSQSSRLFNQLRTAANRRLQERFGKTPTAELIRFATNLNGAIQRTSLNVTLTQWRNDPNSRFLLMRGDDGMGKSWAAAGFADDLAREDGKAVFWLVR